MPAQSPAFCIHGQDGTGQQAEDLSQKMGRTGTRGAHGKKAERKAERGELMGDWMNGKSASKEVRRVV